jgi:hypothetical protein
LVGEDEDMEEALKHLQSHSWKKTAKKEIKQVLKERGVVTLYTNGDKPEWSDEGIERFNHLCLLVTIDRDEDQKKKNRSVEEYLRKEWIREAKEDKIDVRRRKRSPFDESGKWKGKEKAADIECIDLDDTVTDIEQARKRMRMFIENNPGKLDPRIKEWTSVVVDETEDP